MTIRSRLIAAAFVGSAIVALATSASTLFLYRASSHLVDIHTKMIPIVSQAGAVEEEAGNLAQTMEDYMDAKSGGDSVGATAAASKINSQFDALRASGDFLTQHISLETDDHRPIATEVGHFKQAATALNNDWSRLRDVGADHPQFSRVAEFDNEAIRLARSATRLQATAINATAGRVDAANRYVTWVSRLSAVIAAAMSLMTLLTGITFASSLAKRLMRVRDQAQIVGTGNLDAVLEVHGRDEIDDIAMSFNGMVKALRGSREKLERDALYDGLTGLPNRILFMHRLTQRVAEAHRLNDHAYAVYFLDIDRFKQVNDTLGHAAGDELLRTVAARLTETVDRFSFRSGIIKTVARLAGDEFTILLEGEIDADEAASVGERIRAALAVPMNIEDKPLTVTASVGVALGHAGITDPKQVLTQADIALYQTKRQGRNGFCLYNASMEGKEPQDTEPSSSSDTIVRARRDSDAALLT